jgi:hypothetical protein
MSVLTDAEGDCLDKMAEGFVSYYEQSHILLAQQFTGCPNLLVKLDIWHFMQRFAMAC